MITFFEGLMIRVEMPSWRVEERMIRVEMPSCPFSLKEVHIRSRASGFQMDLHDAFLEHFE